MYNLSILQLEMQRKGIWVMVCCNAHFSGVSDVRYGTVDQAQPSKWRT